MKPNVVSEYSKLRDVALHMPGIETFFGILNPGVSLYERSFNRAKARSEHEAFSTALKGNGINVHMLVETIEKASHKRSFRSVLEASTLSSMYNSGNSKAQVKAAKDYISAYSAEDLIITMALKPQVGELANPVFTIREPLSNLYFMRDQQMAIKGDMVLARMSKQQRRAEIEITRIFWRAMGIKTKEIKSNTARIEGGDFIPVGDFALIGIGDRTNAEGAMKFISFARGFSEFALVHQPVHPLMLRNFDPMVDMHLDTYFNIAGPNIAVGQKELMNLAKVEIFIVENDSAKKQRDTNLYDYVTEKGFQVINLSILEQASFASNFLCIDDNKIISPDCSKNSKLVVKSFLEKAKHDKAYEAMSKELLNEYKKGLPLFPLSKPTKGFGLDFEVLDMSNLTGGYGGAHCMSCAIIRN